MLHVFGYVLFSVLFKTLEVSLLLTPVSLRGVATFRAATHNIVLTWCPLLLVNNSKLDPDDLLLL